MQIGHRKEFLTLKFRAVRQILSPNYLSSPWLSRNLSIH